MTAVPLQWVRGERDRYPTSGWVGAIAVWSVDGSESKWSRAMMVMMTVIIVIGTRQEEGWCTYKKGSVLWVLQ